MMRKILLGLLPAIALFSMIGCGDDDTPTTNVNPYLTFKAGDKFTYNYYDHDSTDARVEASKQVYIWTVLRTDLDTLGRSEVTEVEEVRYDATGSTETGRSKVYLIANGQGQVFQYDLVGTAMARFQAASGVDLSPYFNQLSKQWTQITSTKDTSPQVLVDTPTLISQPLDSIEVVGQKINAQLTVGYTARHLGKMSVTVPAKTYADAFSTDNVIKIKAVSKSAFAPVLNVGDVIINDSAMVHTDVDINGGIIRQELTSKTVSLLSLIQFPVQGFELEQTAVVRAAADSTED